MSFVELIANETKIRPEQVRNTLALFDQGSTVPFITRYRKEVTGSLDENQLRLIEERYTYFKELSDRREAILKSIETQGKMTPELKAKIETTVSKTELEDLYLPYKPKRRTRAMMARERLIELICERPIERLAILHTISPDVEAFRDEVCAQAQGGLDPADVSISIVGASVGPHLGPGCVGAAILYRT